MAISTNQERYHAERDKRLHAKGLGQYLSPEQTTQYIPAEDPWIPAGTKINYAPVNVAEEDGGGGGGGGGNHHVKLAIFGAGIGGICAAVRAILEGAVQSVDELVVVDPAGGFGGTWYHNR